MSALLRPFTIVRGPMQNGSHQASWRLATTPLLALLVACSAQVGLRPGSTRMDANGHPVDANGNPVDANGNPIASATGGAGNTNTPGGTGGTTMVDPVTGLPVPVTAPPDPTGAPGVGFFTPRFSRLSYRQWVNATKDLLMLPDLSGLETRITKDALANFDNEASKLIVTPTLRADYQAAAEQLSARVAGDPVALARLIPANAPADLAGKEQAFITTFGTRAYRRPLEASELGEASKLFEQAPTLMPGKDPFLGGAELTMQFFLQSPYYLYRSELSTAQVGLVIPLNDYEVASKLAFSLSNTMPDDALFSSAASGGLKSRDVVLAQAQRLLSTPAAGATLDSFHSQLLRLGGLDTLAKDDVLFPGFTPAVAASLGPESLAFMRWAFTEGHGMKDVLTLPVTFANSAIAGVYGLQGTFTNDLVKVDLKPTERAGLLTRLGFLAANASRTNPSPIRRGAFINERIFCKMLPPPAPGATPLPPTNGTETSTNRQRVEAHTSVCGAACHTAIINPPGFAFENYDAIGGYRTMDNGSPVNSVDSYEFTAGMKQPFNGPIEFSTFAADNADAHHCIAQQWMSYLYARSPAPEDAALRAYLGEKSKVGALAIKDIVLALVNHDAFLTRIPGGQ